MRLLCCAEIPDSEGLLDVHIVGDVSPVLEAIQAVQSSNLYLVMFTFVICLGGEDSEDTCFCRLQIAKVTRLER